MKTDTAARSRNPERVARDSTGYRTAVAKEDHMSYKGKTQLTFIIVAPPDQVAEGDRIFENHAGWMEKTHHRSGPRALLQYTVSKAPEPKNPMDPNAGTTGNTCFILNEFYESPVGVADHFEQASSTFQDFPALTKWLGKCKVTAVPAAPVFNSLW
jgi:hypothetical protein